MPPSSKGLEDQIEIYEEILAQLEREKEPAFWASVQNKRGIAYAARRRGSGAENLEKAIAAYQAALDVTERQGLRVDWAMAQNNLLAGFTLDAVGSAAADATCEAVADHLWEHEARSGEGLTPPFCPGYCGMSIEQQRVLFAVVNSSAIGVELLPTLMMRPVKSISGLIGFGDGQEVESHGVPCQWCDLEDCRMRRHS